MQCAAGGVPPVRDSIVTPLLYTVGPGLLPGPRVPFWGKAMLKGKVAVVTGSTSGIGLAFARAFAKEGANIVINGLGDADAIEKERAGIESDFGVKALYSPANMLKADEIEAMYAGEGRD